MSLENKKILVFTGGGLSPAFNPILYGVIKEAKRKKAKIYGGFYGWQCLFSEGKIIPLKNFDEEKIKDKGGTFLRSSRTNPYIKLKELKRNLKKKAIDYLVVIGGNDTLNAAYKLFKEEKIFLVGVPKTIDNDLSETYWTPGFPTAAYRLINFVKELREPAYTLSRIFIVETMGQNAGWLASSSFLGGADVIIPPERYIDLDRVLRITLQKYKKNKNFAIIVISREAQLGDKIKGILDDQKDGYKVIRHELKCWDLRNEIKRRLKIDAKIIIPGNWLESGNPIPIDKKFAIKLGKKAIDLLSKGKFGWTSIIKKKKNKIVVDSAPLEKLLKNKFLDETYFDFKKLIPKKKFINYIKTILR